MECLLRRNDEDEAHIQIYISWKPTGKWWADNQMPRQSWTDNDLKWGVETEIENIDTMISYHIVLSIITANSINVRADE